MSVNYGLDADLKAKQDAKYDHELEARVVGWIEEVTGLKKENATVAEWLHDGKVLCELANKIQPGSVKKINTSSLPFKQMENITFFMNVARKLGVAEQAIFGTPDLYEEKNMGTVMTAIYTFAGVIQVTVPEFQGPKLGEPIQAKVKDEKRTGVVATQCGGLSSAMKVEKATTGARQVAAGFNPGVKAPPEEGADAQGLDADLKAKQEAKFDPELEKTVCTWIEAVTGESKGDKTSQEWLQSGLVLCNLVNKIKPGYIKKVNTSTLPFKQMENITFYMNAARELGVPEQSMFGTPDLYEGKNMGSVISAINTFGGAIQVSVPEFDGPKLGVAVHAVIDDKRRPSAGTMATSQYEAMERTMQVERPKDGGITKGAQ